MLKTEETTMGFTLREILYGAALSQTSARVEPEPTVECPTGKVGYRTREAADAVLRHVNPTQRTSMHRFRCGACQHFHLGHRRGVIS
jgi:hypothetical protein